MPGLCSAYRLRPVASRPRACPEPQPPRAVNDPAQCLWEQLPVDSFSCHGGKARTWVARSSLVKPGPSSDPRRVRASPRAGRAREPGESIRPSGWSRRPSRASRGTTAEDRVHGSEAALALADGLDPIATTVAGTRPAQAAVRSSHWSVTRFPRCGQGRCGNRARRAGRPGHRNNSGRRRVRPSRRG